MVDLGPYNGGMPENLFETINATARTKIVGRESVPS